jgi:hypothetical protein
VVQAHFQVGLKITELFLVLVCVEAIAQLLQIKSLLAKNAQSLSLLGITYLYCNSRILMLDSNTDDPLEPREEELLQVLY